MNSNTFTKHILFEDNDRKDDTLLKVGIHGTTLGPMSVQELHGQHT